MESTQAPQTNEPVAVKPVAFIIGAGPHIGTAVAHALWDQGYRVVIASRQPKVEVADVEKFQTVTVDAGSPDSIKAAFQTVTKEYGHPSVVIYNAAFLATPPDPTDPLTLPSEQLYESTAVGLGVYVAAQQAVLGFRHASTEGQRKVFIVTGNALPFNPRPTPVFLGLNIQKTIEAKLIATFASSYENENFRFYYATLVSETGGLAGPIFTQSAETHARVYWDLIHHHTEQGNWDFRFTLDGHKYAWYD